LKSKDYKTDINGFEVKKDYKTESNQYQLVLKSKDYKTNINGFEVKKDYKQSQSISISFEVKRLQNKYQRF
jgi:hypothetical protein